MLGLHPLRQRAIAPVSLSVRSALPRVGIAALLVLAPLLCIAFCHVVDAARQPAPTVEFRCVPPSSQQLRLASDDGHAPLIDLRQLIRAMTECAPALWLWVIPAGVLVTLKPIQRPPIRDAVQQPPKPPPRLF
ncbi:MAG: hypothetical protein NZM18_13710 [Thermoflexales bacterium]|nr:hypothetical protein [Thermoflexales bacterium]